MGMQLAEAASLRVEVQAEWVGVIHRRALQLFGQRGLIPPPSPSLIHDHHCQLGLSIWSRLRAQIECAHPDRTQILLDNHPGLSENLPHLLAFGYSIVRLLHRRLHAASQFEDGVGHLGALFNATICCVDRIWDVEQEHRSLLQDQLTEAKIVEALAAGRTDSPGFSSSLDGRPPALPAFTCELLDAYTHGIRSFCETSLTTALRRGWLISSLIALLRAYRAISATRIDADSPSSDLCRALRAIGSGPFLVMAQMSLLTRTECDQAEWTSVSREALRIGDIFRWTDDLVDAFEDLAQNKWNSVWIAFARQGGRIFDEDGQSCPSDALLIELRRSGTIDLMVSRIAHRIAQLDRTEADEVSTWVWAWLSC